MNLFGTFTGPLISTNIYLFVGFDYCCVIIGCTQMVFAIIFYTVIHYQAKTKASHYREDYKKLVEINDKAN